MKQILIITPPGHPGTLADIAGRLGDRGVNITDIDASDDHAHGVIRLQAERGIACLLVTHDRNLVEGVAHREIVLTRRVAEAG